MAVVSSTSRRSSCAVFNFSGDMPSTRSVFSSIFFVSVSGVVLFSVS